MTIPNFNIPQTPPIMPPQMPLPPAMQDADNAMKLFNWMKESGLTPEQLEALAKLKKDGKDIDKLLGIEKPKTDIEKLADSIQTYMSDTDRKITMLADENRARKDKIMAKILIFLASTLSCVCYVLGVLLMIVSFAFNGIAWVAAWPFRSISKALEAFAGIFFKVPERVCGK